MGNEIDNRDYNDLSDALKLAKTIVYKDYLGSLSEYSLILPGELLLDEEPKRCSRMFKLEKLSCKNNEDIFQKLSTIYHAAMSLGSTVFLMIDAPGIDNSVDIYLGVRTSNELLGKNKNALRISFEALKNGLDSNFQGSREVGISSSKDMPELLNVIFQEGSRYISSVSCVASIRKKEKTEKREFIQGIEKMIDTMRGKPYTALFIAEPVSAQEQSEIRMGYQKLYSTLSSFRKSTWSYNENESESVMTSLSHGISENITEGVSHTQSHTMANTKGKSDTFGINFSIGGNKTNTEGKSEAHTDTSPTDESRAGAVISSFAGALSQIPVATAAIPGIGKVLLVAKGIGIFAGAVGAAMQGSSTADSVVKSIGKSLGLNASLGGNYSHSNFSSVTESNGTAEVESDSLSKGHIDTSTDGTTKTTTNGKILQVEIINKDIEELLVRIDEQLRRIKECEDYGAYNCGAYFLSSREENCLLAANTYRALMVGEDSSVERGAVNLWDDEDVVSIMKEYLKRFAHPVFAMPYGENNKLCFPQTAGTIVSGLELPLHLGLPTKSVVGLPVIEHAEFGKNIPVSDKSIGIGKLHYMGYTDDDIDISLDKSSLAKHTFITGSTGSGKSNTIYKMLEKLTDDNVNFLVIEPAKGEYKEKIACNGKVAVFGTNPNLSDSQLLRINPFRFPKSIHVLEHLDRLVEIFNACWPMYAAMPAIMKDAIERAYRRCGWDLEKSINKYDSDLFPSFTDVTKQIKEVLHESDYSSDSKGDYIGSLVTRLRSLTNGINGLIFTTDDISDEELFDGNVIVDISRIGSSETKSLIMGILVFKLQEHRMEQRSNGANIDDDLKHVTVLEEAHNLLRRTSVQQVSEASNLVGKSVEMLANSISEMRTYGEGFIIADQSPGLLDMSVIRNTNTKIILRLPDYSDRELVGKSAGLSEDQIIELAKLEKGVAAVSQSDWLEPVLCKIDKYDADKKMIEDPIKNKPVHEIVDTEKLSDSILDCLLTKEIYRKGDRIDIKKLRKLVIKSKLGTEVKCSFIDYIDAGAEDAVEALRSLAFEFFNAEEAVYKSKKCDDITKWVHSVVDNIHPGINGYSKEQIDLLMSLLIYELSLRNNDYDDLFCRFTEVYKHKGGVF